MVADLQSSQRPESADRKGPDAFVIISAKVRYPPPEKTSDLIRWIRRLSVREPIGRTIIGVHSTAIRSDIALIFPGLVAPLSANTYLHFRLRPSELPPAPLVSQIRIDESFE